MMGSRIEESKSISSDDEIRAFQNMPESMRCVLRDLTNHVRRALPLDPTSCVQACVDFFRQSLQEREIQAERGVSVENVERLLQTFSQRAIFQLYRDLGKSFGITDRAFEDVARCFQWSSDSLVSSCEIATGLVAAIQSSWFGTIQTLFTILSDEGELPISTVELIFQTLQRADPRLASCQPMLSEFLTSARQKHDIEETTISLCEFNRFVEEHQVLAAL